MDSAEVETTYVVEVGEKDDARLDILNTVFSPLSRELLQQVQLNKKEGAIAVDLGCGNGKMTVELARHFDHVIAVDNNLDQLEVTRKYIEKMRSAETLGQVDYLQADALTMGKLLPSKVDLIYCRFVLMHTKAQQKVLDSLYHCLVPKGCLVIEEPAHYRVASTPHSDAILRAIKVHLEWSKKMGLDFELGPKIKGYLKTAGFTIDYQEEATPDPVSAKNPEGQIIKLLHKNCMQKYIEAGFNEQEMQEILELLGKDLQNSKHTIQPISVSQYIASKQ